jgi:hypothetical protein
MSDCATTKMRFQTEAALALVAAAFDGGRSSDQRRRAPLAQRSGRRELGLCEAMAECVPEWRRRKGRHSLIALW